MKAGWDIKRIGDVCDLMTGGTPSKSKPEYFDGGDIRWLVSGDVNKKVITDCEGRITKLGFDNSSAKYLPVNSVMIALNGQGKTRGTVALLKVKATCNQSLVSINPKDPEKLLPEYLYANLHGRYEEIRKITGDDGNDRRGLNMPLIRNIQIPIAPVEEQKRIVSILNEAFAGIDTAIANTEKNLANTRELFESYLNAVFTKRGEGWEDIKLDDACIVERGSSPRPIKEFLTDDEDGVNWVKIGDTKGITKYIKTTKQKITNDGALRSRKVNPGDFILTNSMSFGRPYIMATTGYIHDGWFVLRIKEHINTDYFYHLLSSRIIQDQFGVLAAGAVVKNISSELVKRAILPIPPIEQQVEIIKIIEILSEQVQQLESIYKEKLTSLTELKQSLLQKAFSGELTEGDKIDISKSEPNVVAMKPNKPPSKAFTEAILISQFVRAMSNEKYVLGRKRYNKLCYLAHRRNEDDVQQQYLKKAAGPYSPWAKYGGPEKIAMNNGYIKPAKRGVYSGFEAGSNISDVDKYIANYPVCSAVDWVVDNFKDFTTDELELFATVDFAAMDLIEQSKEVSIQSVKSIIATNKEWAPKLKREIFNNQNIQRALKELSELFPASLGSVIVA